MFPIEQTKLSIEMTGPMIGPQTLAASGCPVRNRCCQKVFGTQAATAPAISRPRTMSLITAAHSMTKMWLTEVYPSRLASRFQKPPLPEMLMSMAA